MNEPARIYAQAVEALNRNQWAQALQHADRVLAQVRDHAGVHFVAGVSALHLRLLPRALPHLQRAVELSPQRADYAAQYARALSTAQLFRQALETAEQAMAKSPDDPLTLDTLGVVFTQTNAHLQAIEAFRLAAARMPDVASYRFNLATSLMFTGELDEAEREYEACLALEPRYWKAHLALAQLRKQTPETQHLDRLRTMLAANSDQPPARMYLNLAMAKELEDLQQFPESFAHLSAGKSAGGEGRRYTASRDEVLFEAIMRAHPQPLPEVAGSGSDEPIFVIGMPRSGTTLIDRILSSHGGVHSAGELQNFGVVLKRATGSTTTHLLDPDTIARALRVDPARLGDAYVASTRPGTGHTRHFVDKLPHNFLYAGFIARALPKAKIVVLRRNPMDTCLSNFRQLFAQTSPYYDYSFDLLDTGRYYVLFDRLMAHWDRVLPGRILRVDYETLVDQQEVTTRGLLDFCGLEWDPACLSFEQNEAPVATASAVQVREGPIRGSIGRWKRYGDELEPLRNLLLQAGIALPD